MDGQMDGWVVMWVGGCMDEWMDVWLDGVWVD